MACAACATAPSPGGVASIKVGALFPLTGPQAALAKQEYAGVQIARDFANADGGIAGAPIALIAKDLTSEADAPDRVQELKVQGVKDIMGAYSSSLSMPVSSAAQQDGFNGCVHVDAVIGSTLAQCIPVFGAVVGADAIGVFPSARPPHGFIPDALNVTGRAIYTRFATAYRRGFSRDPSEEALAGLG